MKEVVSKRKAARDAGQNPDGTNNANPFEAAEADRDDDSDSGDLESLE